MSYVPGSFETQGQTVHSPAYGSGYTTVPYGMQATFDGERAMMPESKVDDFEVIFDGRHDVRNPQNWSLVAFVSQFQIHLSKPTSPVM
jgi:hypothetical protein